MTSTSTATFFTVKYGANDEQLFNSDCYLKLLVNSIKRRCNCDESEQLVLADEEDCGFIDLTQLSNPLQNGQSMFSGRGVYVLLSIDRSDKDKPKYKSLLDGPYMSPELAEKLEEYSNPNHVKSRPRRGSISSTPTKAAVSKRRASVPNIKRQPQKITAPISSITE